ncbi:hypothetical protein GUITHDRAFT_98995 [Guillardia theta CCMP2712]|uniref:Uncharacterized protein n=1 Tax=Guillardia theta (strain CCMP2712) TaxID=905079 RepID=L1K413_GUITC|nr:hypothetical protein GUITHDRAFT_98995 [Guillardia theta CCMP2712]EKX55215.1 hypothetical protein GUITHDRAFT_98995 [Guillardia theta CCMP2712]|eukprot:XP_005842195.1 hypothetical protein GUITHDRAFT_98995 [Guillardia theta CCMP2712]
MTQEPATFSKTPSIEDTMNIQHMMNSTLKQDNDTCPLDAIRGYIKSLGEKSDLKGEFQLDISGCSFKSESSVRETCSDTVETGSTGRQEDREHVIERVAVLHIVNDKWIKMQVCQDPALPNFCRLPMRKLDSCCWDEMDLPVHEMVEELSGRRLPTDYQHFDFRSGLHFYEDEWSYDEKDLGIPRISSFARSKKFWMAGKNRFTFANFRNG